MSDGEEVIASSHATGTSEGTKSSSAGTEEPSLTLKNRRKQLRGKVTRTINRVRKFITDQDQTKRRIEKELEELRKDFELARDVHAELYGYVDPSQVPKLDEWENVLTDDVFGVEEEAETYFKTLGNPSASVQQEVSAPTPSFVQQQTPGLIAQGSESSEPSASHEAGENLQDSVSGQQDIVSGIVQQQAPSTAQGSSNVYHRPWMATWNWKEHPLPKLITIYRKMNRLLILHFQKTARWHNRKEKAARKVSVLPANLTSRDLELFNLLNQHAPLMRG